MPNATSKTATKSCASLRNSLQPTPIQDKTHKGFPEKTRLTTPGFTNSIQQQSFFLLFLLFHHQLRSSCIQPSETRLPTSPTKQQTDRRQSVPRRLCIFRNFSKIKRFHCLTCFCTQKEPDLVPLQWGRDALLVPVSYLTFFPCAGDDLIIQRVSILLHPFSCVSSD